MRLQIGKVTFDAERRQLLRGDMVVHVSPKAFALLATLLERRPRAVSKAEIHEALWPGVFVSETNLPALVNELRVALGDDARHPAFVRTVHGFGYAFAAEAPAPREVPAGGSLAHRLIWGAVEIDLPEGESVLGRDRDAGVWIADASVSRRHARVVVRGAEATLEDLSTKNGTFVNGERVTGRVALADGASLRLGNLLFTYRAVSTSASTVTDSD